jgi:hypothetical protein
VQHRPIRGSAHGRVEGRLGGGANSSACGGPGASNAHGSSVQGPSATSGGTSGGTHTSYEEQKVGQRVASDGARSNAYEGTNSGCCGQGASGARGGASGGARTGCDEGRAVRRVGARGGGGANGCGDTHNALKEGGGGSLKGGDGHNQGGRSNASRG